MESNREQSKNSSSRRVYTKSNPRCRQVHVGSVSAQKQTHIPSKSKWKRGGIGTITSKKLYQMDGEQDSLQIEGNNISSLTSPYAKDNHANIPSNRSCEERKGRECRRIYDGFGEINQRKEVARVGKRRHRRQGPVKITESDFQSFHKLCRAARYKVHKPGCSCSKIRDIKQRILLNQIGKLEQQKVSTLRNNDKQSTSTATENGKLDELGGPIGRDASFLEGLLDGLVVVPDVRTPDTVYVCTETGSSSFDAFRQKAELKLKNEIFGFDILLTKLNSEKELCRNVLEPKSILSTSTTGGFLGQSTSHCSSCKISCAQCMLEKEPNGFVCISSTCYQSIAKVRQMAMFAAKDKVRQGSNLHADHSDFVCVLSRKTLWQMLVARTQDQKAAAAAAVTAALAQQGLPLNSAMAQNSSSLYNIQHHLESFLYITKFDRERKSMLWFTILYNDMDDPRKRCWSIDLPGGKRHLGETALEGALRETEEETSLLCPPSWIIGEPRYSKREPGNAYFVLHPPNDSSLSELDDMSHATDKLHL